MIIFGLRIVVAGKERKDKITRILGEIEYESK